MAIDPIQTVLAAIADLLRLLLGTRGESQIDAIAEDGTIGAHAVGAL